MCACVRFRATLSHVHTRHVCNCNMNCCVRRSCCSMYKPHVRMTKRKTCYPVRHIVELLNPVRDKN